MNGLLLVDKPGMPPLPEAEWVAAAASIRDAATGDPRRSPYPTSHDVVQRVRRFSRQRRIGHTGTLDPMASGLMVLCLGWATRLVEYYQRHDKSYRAEIALGSETDTLDALGKIVDSAAVPFLTIADIEQATGSFRGTILQTPPLYSALKRDGESLHYKARRGETVEVEARPVTIHALEVVAFTPPDRITLEITCSAGTYVRSLARDLGIALGTRATLVGLRRVAAGAFSVINAQTLHAIEAAASVGNLESLLLPAGEGLDLPTVVIDSTTAERLGHGQIVTLDNTPESAFQMQARSATGTLLGMLQRVEGTRWKADKWFANQVQ